MVTWRTASEKDLPKDRAGVPFTLAAGDQWQDVLLDLPIEGTSAIIQLHLPAASAPVDIASIRYTSGDRAHAWDFSGVTP
jgi:hypothetical protein